MENLTIEQLKKDKQNLSKQIGTMVSEFAEKYQLQDVDLSVNRVYSDAPPFAITVIVDIDIKL